MDAQEALDIVASNSCAGACHITQFSRDGAMERNNKLALAVLRAVVEASPASPDIRPAGYNRPLSGQEVISAEDEKALATLAESCGWYEGDTLETNSTDADALAHLRARLSAPAGRVSREWLRFQAGEIWSSKTLDDAEWTLAETLKGFGVEVEGE